MSNKANQEITDKVIAYIQSNEALPWTQPWFGTAWPVSHLSGKRYSLLNAMAIFMSDEAFGFGKASEYITWNQIQKTANAHLRKGSKGQRVYFYSTFDKTETDKDGNTIIRQVPFLKTYTVFNVDDCEGISRKWQTKITNPANTPIETVEAVINKYISRNNIEIRHERNEAFYSIKSNYINIPVISNFRSTEDYYNVLMHELTHSSGKFLGRFKEGDSTSPFGSPDYSREELVAEMGASFLLNHFGIANTHTLKQNAAYVKSWIRALRNDVTLITVAANKAERAVQYILGEDIENAVE